MRVTSVIAVGMVAVWGAAGARAADGDLSLADAVKNGNREAVRLLLRNRSADVNAREEDGTTALYWAVRWCLAGSISRRRAGG